MDVPLFSCLTRRDCLSRALALCVAPAAGNALAQSRTEERAVVINLSLEPDSLDPTMAHSAAVGEITHYNVFEGLTQIEESSAVSPLLAESWSATPNGLAHTFRLRQGVRFHDGSVMDAAAVRFSFERAVAPGSTNKSRKALFENIAAIATPDAHTVTLTLHHPDPHLLFRLGEGPAVILHPASAAQAASAPVGTGPYRLDRWDRGQRVMLVKASTHRNAARVRMERATYRFVHDLEAQEAALRAGEIDVLFNFATQTVRWWIATPTPPPPASARRSLPRCSGTWRKTPSTPGSSRPKSAPWYAKGCAAFP